VLSIFPLLFLSQQNIGRSIFIVLVIIFWCVLAYVIKSYIKSALFVLVFIFALNITFVIPNLGGNLYIESLNGVYVNWLLPVISIADMFVCILLWELILENLTLFKNRNLQFIILFVLLFSALQYFSHMSIVTLAYIFRYFIYFFSGIFLLSEFLSEKISAKDLYIAKSLFVISALFQIIIAAIQVNSGASLGLDFLGESRLVVSVYGVSFINIFDQVFLRGYGTFPHPNVLSGFLIFAILIAQSMELKKIAKFIVIFALSAGVLLTFSKIGIFTMSVIVFVICISPLLKKINIYKYVWVLLFVMPFILIFTQVFNLGIFSLSDSTSWVDRNNLLISAVSVFKENYLLGTGLGGFVFKLADYVPTTVGGFALLQPVHNIFVLWLVENGLLGVSAFLAAFFYGVKRSELKFEAFSGMVANIEWIIMCIAVVLLGSFDHYLLTLSQGFVLLNIFLFYSAYLLVQKQKESSLKHNNNI
jgi:hypothetical protein